MQIVSNKTINEVRTQKPENRSAAQTGSQINFNEVLSNTIANQNVHFSKHANMRLTSRDIELSPNQIKRVEEGISQAKEKGINDSLVLVDNIALVVNVKSRMVITALGNENKNVFTNIDGAVIV